MTKILVIEDEHLLRREILTVLGFEGFESVGAEDGVVGVQMAREHRPDLIICDVMMPRLDGYGVLSELRSDPVTAVIPFVFLTAKADKTDLRAGMDLGADDYLTKPFTHDELLAAINARLGKRAILEEATEQKLEDLREQILLSLPHELRTPLMAILGYSELLLDGGESLGPDSVAQIGQTLYKAGVRLYHLIENYLAYIQIKLARQSPAQMEVLRSGLTKHPRSGIENWAMLGAQHADRTADLHLDVVDVPIVPIYHQYLKKIVEELVDNAFKFSTAGTPVEVAATVEDECYVARVSDQGRGMTPEQIEEIAAYAQFDRKIQEQQGLGLGLVIAKQLAELHNGQLIIDSAPRQGTTVRFVLPLS